MNWLYNITPHKISKNSINQFLPHLLCEPCKPKSTEIQDRVMLTSVPSTGIFFHFLRHFYHMPCSVLIHAYFWDHTWPCTLLSHWNVNGRIQSRWCRISWEENEKKYCVKPHSASKRHTWYEWERKVLGYLLQITEDSW